MTQEKTTKKYKEKRFSLHSCYHLRTMEHNTSYTLGQTNTRTRIVTFNPQMHTYAQCTHARHENTQCKSVYFMFDMIRTDSWRFVHKYMNILNALRPCNSIVLLALFVFLMMNLLIHVTSMSFESTVGKFFCGEDMTNFRLMVMNVADLKNGCVVR